ncbi:helix-turn-helix domain-containing protein [Herbaspirillum camelliae]|uniref:helix-turn-helix domain-containing protein n=1 Tax=Herbaspirillum camelliae TaxID=1892903 RepID=UPI000949D46D|nr:helix-turn-helix transcriptional regulator [Herbaspirillum camelliae]
MNSASLIYDFYSTNTKQIINAKFCLLTELRRAVELKFRKALGRAVRRLRIQAAITQEDLAFEAGLERSYVSSIELAHKDPSFTTLQKIAAALNHSLLDLFQICNDPAKPAQVMRLKQTPQPVSSCPAPDAAGGGYRSRSSHQ